jgi:hypothetical protein
LISIIDLGCRVCALEKQQIIHRLPREFVLQTLDKFNAGLLDAATAASQLGIGRSQLYRMRTAWLAGRHAYGPRASGGDHHGLWPNKVHAFLRSFLPVQNPPNYQLVCDELERLCGFARARSTVEAYVKTHFAHLVPKPPPKNRVYRRFRRAKIGELWQHDSSIHQWWPAPRKQTLLLTVDDHSGLNVAGRFVTSDTTWNHFLHFREAFETHGIPEIVYTDGLSLFGPSSADDRADPKSNFQRAFLALGITHLVAPTPQAKGKIERRFGTFQNRLVTLLAHANAATWKQADEILQLEIHRQNGKVNRSTGKVPFQILADAQLAANSSMRPCPPASLLDLHLSLRTSRRVNHDHTIDFEGRNFEIAATKRKFVTIVHHPHSKFWVLELPPKDVWPSVLGAFSL